MRQKTFWIAASCILAVIALRPLFSSGAAPASTEKVIYSFTGGNDGEYPSSDLTLDSEGNLYGTTTDGGGTCVYHGVQYPGCGTVFELKRGADGWKEQVIHSFKAGNEGSFPGAGVIFDKVGNLYGTTTGFDAEDGNVFKLTPNLRGGWTESVLYRFSSGFWPQPSLVFDSQGNLFGVTPDSVFELMPQSNGSWKEVTLHNFTGAPDGAIPSSAVVLDSLGNVYGLTESGGTGMCEYVTRVPGCGIVYELTPTSDGKWTETIIYEFARGGGFAVNPMGGLILDNASHLFGTTVAGGNGIGTVFELTRLQKGWEQRVLHRFYGNPDGENPLGKLEKRSDGVLFGVTSRGGKSDAGSGTVFELEPSETNGWRERILHSFAGGRDGSNPLAGVVSDSQGHLYGTTQTGGSGTGCNESCGTVYEITP
jgi:hypothetical protein